MDEHEHEELEGFEVGVGIVVGQREGNEQSGFYFTCLTYSACLCLQFFLSMPIQRG